MKAKNSGNGITPSKDGKTATVKCGRGIVKVRYEGRNHEAGNKDTER